MSPVALDTPIVTTDALRSVNFFNGRLLTGDDLRAEQATQRSRLARLARAGGDGIAYGLRVRETVGTSTAAKPVVTVSAGLALARSGQALELGEEIDVALAREGPVAGSEPGGLFADCQPFVPGTYTAGAGVYLLTIGPAQRDEGRAQVSGLDNVPSACNVAKSAEGICCKLIRLALTPAELADRDRLRSRVASACFGVGTLARFVVDPFGPPPQRYGLVDALREETLSDDEVPIATVGWSLGEGLQFVDEWMVRRPLIASRPDGAYASLLSERRRAEGDAMINQFQAHAGDLHQGAPSIRATDHFLRLPQLGVIPVGAGEFHADGFFAGLTVARTAFVPAAEVGDLVDESLLYPPIELGQEAIRRYLVRENRQDAPAGAGPYLVFVNGHVRYHADAQYDLAYWDFANYAQCC